MNYKELVKSIGENEKVVLYGFNGDKVTIEHNYDYVYTVRLNRTAPRDFLLSEVAAWLDFYESKRGALTLPKEVQKNMQAQI